MNLCIIFAVVILQLLQETCCEEWGSWSACNDGLKERTTYKAESDGSSCYATISTSCESSGGDSSCDVTTEEWGSWEPCNNGLKNRARCKDKSDGSKCFALSTIPCGSSGGDSDSSGADCGSSGGDTGSSGGDTGSSGENTDGSRGSPVGPDQQGCLDAHNKYRKIHNAPPLLWDAGIAKEAQEWADKIEESGNMKHSKDKYGENLAYSSYPNADGANAVKLWYDEICLYQNCDPPTAGTGHFTQVVWKDSKYLGCAVARNGNKVYTVGKYSPPGNYRGQYCKKVGKLEDVSKAKADACP